MDTTTRRKLEMAARVRDFSKANPSADPSYTDLLTRLEEGIDRAQELSAQQRAGQIQVGKSTERRKELRSALHESLIRHLVPVAQVASQEVPEVEKGFRLLRPHSNHEKFLTAARAMATEARSRSELFLRHGMATTLLDDLDLALKEYDVALEEAHAGLRARVGAGAELVAVTAELMRLVDVFDGLNRYRYRDHAEQRAAWDSAKNVVGPDHPKVEEPAEGTAPVEVKPAA